MAAVASLYMPLHSYVLILRSRSSFFCIAEATPRRDRINRRGRRRIGWSWALSGTLLSCLPHLHHIGRCRYSSATLHGAAASAILLAPASFARTVISSAHAVSRCAASLLCALFCVASFCLCGGCHIGKRSERRGTQTSGSSSARRGGKNNAVTASVIGKRHRRVTKSSGSACCV